MKNQPTTKTGGKAAEKPAVKAAAKGIAKAATHPAKTDAPKVFGSAKEVFDTADKDPGILFSGDFSDILKEYRMALNAEVLHWHQLGHTLTQIAEKTNRTVALISASFAAQGIDPWPWPREIIPVKVKAAHGSETRAPSPGESETRAPSAPSAPGAPGLVVGKGVVIEEKNPLSPALSEALKKAGAEVSDALVAKTAASVDKKRAEWLVEAVRLGLLLIAKKSALGHGKFGKWMAKFSESNWQRVANLNSTKPRELRSYLYLAHRYLAAFDAGIRIDARSTFALDGTFDKPEFKTLAGNVNFLATSSASEGFASCGTTAALKAFVAGRSMRQLLSDLREAEKEADEEERAENTLIDAATGKPLTLEQEASIPHGTPEQLELALDKLWLRDVIPSIDAAFKASADRASRLSNAQLIHFWENCADDLKKKAAQAENYACCARAGTLLPKSEMAIQPKDEPPPQITDFPTQDEALEAISAPVPPAA